MGLSGKTSLPALSRFGVLGSSGREVEGFFVTAASDSAAADLSFFEAPAVAFEGSDAAAAAPTAERFLPTTFPNARTAGGTTRRAAEGGIVFQSSRFDRESVVFVFSTLCFFLFLSLAFFFFRAASFTTPKKPLSINPRKLFFYFFQVEEHKKARKRDETKAIKLSFFPFVISISILFPCGPVSSSSFSFF